MKHFYWGSFLFSSGRPLFFSHFSFSSSLSFSVVFFSLTPLPFACLPFKLCTALSKQNLRTSLNKLAKRKERNDHADRYLLLYLHTSFLCFFFLFHILLLFFISLSLRCCDWRACLDHLYYVCSICWLYIGRNDVGVLACETYPTKHITSDHH